MQHRTASSPSKLWIHIQRRALSHPIFEATPGWMAATCWRPEISTIHRTKNARSCFICFGGYIWALPIQPGFHSQPFIYYAAGFDAMTDEPHAVWYFPRWLSYRDKSRSVAIQIILSLNCWADGTTISGKCFSRPLNGPFSKQLAQWLLCSSPRIPAFNSSNIKINRLSLSSHVHVCSLPSPLILSLCLPSFPLISSLSFGAHLPPIFLAFV